MIELANDAKAGPTGWRPMASREIRQPAPDARRSRSGPAAWPFPSRYAARPAQQDMRKNAANDSGS
jgi:hypothetical protein